MPEKKYAEIDQTKDFKDLFELVCSEVLSRTTMEVKRDILKWKGTDKELSTKAITANDLFLLFDKIDMPFKLKIRYVVPLVKEVVIPPPAEPAPIVNAMEEQKKAIHEKAVDNLNKMEGVSNPPDEKSIPPAPSGSVPEDDDPFASM